MSAAYLRGPAVPAGRIGNGRAAGCLGKWRFEAPALAHAVAVRARVPAQAYRCRHCGGWHVGFASAVPLQQRRAANLVREERVVVP